jgi:small subunit ribosomal protein S11
MIKKIKNKRNIKYSNKKYKICKIFIKKTLNNTFITLTNIKGNTLIYYSSGKLGFKGAKRSTSHASESIFQQIIKYCLSLGIKSVLLYFNGLGYNLKTFVKPLSSNKIKIFSIINNTPIPYNGCRKPKVRRV